MYDLINLSVFRQFCSTHFSLWERAKRLRDGRQKPQITTRQIFESVLFGGIFRKKGFLQLDQLLRQPQIRKFIDTPRSIVASDTEIPRVLTTMEVSALRQLNRLVYLRSKTQHLLRLKDDRLDGLRIGALDGSCFGKFWATCFQVLGRPPILLDFEPMSQRGKELPTAQVLVKRLSKTFGKKWVDIVLLDGLYVAQGFINACFKAGLDVLIKTEETELNILEDAEGIFNASEEIQKDVEYVTGMDAERLTTYQIWAGKGFSLSGVKKPFKVARVQEQGIKNNQTTIFWVISSRETLSAKQMRELAHWRWSIENNGYKQLNEQVGSKHIWTHQAEVWMRLFPILLMAFNLIGLFEAYLETAGLKVARLTRGYLTSLLFISLIKESGDQVLS